MDYEKKYKEALERAREALNDGTISSNAIAYLQDILPELRESEDEKIRKVLINLFKIENFNGYTTLNGIDVDDVIAWLEKQGEQKSADKVKPKFKVGDWVVDNCNNLWKIVGIMNGFYILEDGDEGGSRPTIEWVDKTFHLWTIQDAKDGDVLASYHEQPFIYNGNYDSFCVGAHCGIDCFGAVFITDECDRDWTGNKDIHPATKKQRDLLFKKMHEAGYEWDAEKKKLKKLKQ